MDDKLYSDYKSNVFFLVLFLFSVLLCVSIVYFSSFRGSLGSQEVFGQFGDFFGGILNPLLSFAAILLIIWSIRLQIHELTDTRKELKKSADAQADIVNKNVEALELQRQLFTLNQSVAVLDNVRKEIDKLISIKFIPISGNLYSLYEVAISTEDVKDIYLKLLRKNNGSSAFDKQLSYNHTAIQILMFDYKAVVVHFIKGLLPDTSVDYYLTAYLINLQTALALHILDTESYEIIFENLAKVIDESSYGDSFKVYFKRKLKALKVKI